MIMKSITKKSIGKKISVPISILKKTSASMILQVTEKTTHMLKEKRTMKKIGMITPIFMLVVKKEIGPDHQKNSRTSDSRSGKMMRATTSTLMKTGAMMAPGLTTTAKNTTTTPMLVRKKEVVTLYKNTPMSGALLTVKYMVRMDLTHQKSPTKRKDGMNITVSTEMVSGCPNIVMAKATGAPTSKIPRLAEASTKAVKLMVHSQ